MTKVSNKYVDFTKNTAVFAIGNLTVKLIQFFLLPLLTAKLATSAYNTVELLNSTIELVLPVLTLGLSEAVFRFAINTEYNPKSVFTNGLTVGLLGIGLFAVILIVIGIVYPQNYWLLFGILYVVSTFNSIMSNYVRGIGRIKTYALASVANAVFMAFGAFLFIYIFDFGANGYLLALICGYSVAILIKLLFGRVVGAYSPKAYDGTLLRSMTKYSLPLIPNNISWWLVHVASKYICTLVLGGAISGLYTAASKIPALINVCATVFFQAWTISSAKTINDENKGEFNSNIFKYLSCFLVMAASAIYVILPYLSKFLLQGEFYVGWTYSGILILASVLACYTSYFGAFYGANMQTKMVFVSTMVGAVVNVAFAFAFIYLIGINALLYASLLAYIVIVVIRYITTKKYSQVKINYWIEAPSLLIISAQALIITYAEGTNTWIQLALFAALLLLRFKDIWTLLKTFAGILTGLIHKNKKAEEQITSTDNQKDGSADDDADIQREKDDSADSGTNHEDK